MRSAKRFCFVGVMVLILNLCAVTVTLAYEKPKPLPDMEGMSPREAFVAVAQSQLGYRADENRESYFGAWAGDAKQAWCSEFVAWSAEQAGIPDSVIPRARGSAGYRKFFADANRFYLLEGGCVDETCGCRQLACGNLRPEDLEPGDILIADTNGNISDGPDHSCIFLCAEGELLRTLDGNSNYMVREVSRNVSRFHGVCRPDFTKTAIGTDRERYTVKEGEKISIRAYVMNADGKKITYKSKNRGVARVSKKGTVRGVRKGRCHITLRCRGVKKVVEVIVV